MGLHHPEPVFVEDTETRHACPVHLENGGPLILKVCIGVFTVNIEDDLTDGKLRLTIACKRISGILIEEIIRLPQEIWAKGRGVAYVNGRLNDLLHGIRFSAPTHTKERSSFSHKLPTHHI